MVCLYRVSLPLDSGVYSEVMDIVIVIVIVTSAVTSYSLTLLLCKPSNLALFLILKKATFAKCILRCKRWSGDLESCLISMPRYLKEVHYYNGTLFT